MTATLPTFAGTATFSEVGTPVTIDKPSATEAAEVPDALRRLLTS